MSARLCGDLEAFYDGELAPGRAEVFRRHLAGCTSCADNLGELAQLFVLEERRRQRPPKESAAPAYLCHLVEAYASGRLARAEAARFSAHLEGCSACARHLAARWADLYGPWAARQPVTLVATAMFALAVAFLVLLVLAGGAGG